VKKTDRPERRNDRGREDEKIREVLTEWEY
jgi:hypothetical protein